MPDGSRLLRVVIDTNVLFSAVAFPQDSPPSRVLDLARTGRIEAFVSGFILKELEKNLFRKAGWDAERISTLRKKLKGFLWVIEPASRVRGVAGKEDDDRILECALDAKAEALVTGSMKHIRVLGEFQGVRILTPREFLDRYFPA
ncbi:MAG TPA: putative toxin-antitoxin system toxin component, PIN family [Elusimicrobia bacterium]|nr:putative toxin-antitoxin system toxin component, PIN family [Elusimicrobiota bacterium]